MFRISQIIFVFIISQTISILPGNLSAQSTIIQTVRGTVVDKSSQSPLPGANIILSGSDPLIGTVTDQNGNFTLTDIPIGRQSFEISFVGYQSQKLSNQIISSAKELILRIELEENIVSASEVTITAQRVKDKPLNPMALVSARSFTIEETNKYAGSYGDPARMAANYAGVFSTRDNRNDIVIRGNSSMGLQYRVDGIEIANPNHFAALGTTGGPLTILNTNLLTNSDFLTGAFPAEYGNAIAGIFDLKMRNGNIDEREYWIQMGFNGLELGIEGPVSRKSGSSYLAAYRYSFVDIIEKLGIKLEESADYQDLTFKLNFPTAKAGTFTILSIGGTSGIQILDSDQKKEKWTFPEHGEDIISGSAIGTFGVSNQYFINSNTRIKSSISFSGSEVETHIDTFSIAAPEKYKWAGERSTEMKYSASFGLYQKINRKNDFSFGTGYDLWNVDYADSTFIHKAYKLDTKSKSAFGHLKAFFQWEHKFGTKLVTYLGLHYHYLSLNSTKAAEPRLGISWNINQRHSFNLGFGMHSQMQPGMIYFVRSADSSGNVILPNFNMDFSKTIHYVLGYNFLINENLRLKAETYYQHLYDIPVSVSIPQYSILNEGTSYFVDRQDSLINKGTGENYGVELTLEKFFSKNYYYLFTASLFQSKYKGYDGVLRNTSFNGNYILNGVAGYEIPFGKRKNRVLVTGLRITWAGGNPYVPYNPEATIASGEVVYDWKDAYTKRYADHFRSSIRFGLKRNEKKFNMQFVIDLQYRANYTYVYLYRIDVLTGDIYKTYKMGFYPMANWRIQF
jgi:hypothetical protein